MPTYLTPINDSWASVDMVPPVPVFINVYLSNTANQELNKLLFIMIYIYILVYSNRNSKFKHSTNSVLYDGANMESFCIQCLLLKAYFYAVTEDLY